MRALRSFWRTILLAGLLLAPAASALAAAYLFPGNLPAGCSASGSNTYACGSLTLAAADTITIVNKPATVNVSGNLSVGSAQVNAAGTAADLTINLTAMLSTGTGGRVVGAVNAVTLFDSGGATFIGNLKAAGGGLTIGAGSNVTGNLTGTGGTSVTLGLGARVTGAITVQTGGVTLSSTLAQPTTVSGSITGTSGSISLNAYSSVGGAISCSCWLGVYNNVTITGAASSTTFDNSLGGGTFGGSVSTTSGTLTLGSGSRITGNASSTSADVNLYSNSAVSGSVSASSWVRAWNGVSVGSTVTGYGVDNGAGSSTFGASVTGTSGWVTIGTSSVVNGAVTAGGGDVNLYPDSIVRGNVQASAWVNAWPRVAISGTTTGVVVNASGGHSSTFGGNVTATNGWVNLDHNSQVTGQITATGGGITLQDSTSVTGSVSATGGDVWLQASSTVAGSVSSTATVTLGWYVNVGGGITATTMSGGAGYYVTIGGDVSVTAGGAVLGNESTISGNLVSTTGTVSLQGGSDVLGNLVCSCTLYTSSANVVGPVQVTTLSDSGASTFRAGVQASAGATLGNGSGLTGDLTSLQGNVVQGSASSVTGCVRSRTGTITLYNASGTGGVCCGTSSCGSSCVYNFSGHGMPSACASTLPLALAEYRFDESSWSGATGEVKDSSGALRHASKLSTVSSSSVGKLCRSASIPSDASSTSTAISTPIDIDSIVGTDGSVSFWYRAPAAWNTLAAGELFDATTVSGQTFHMVRLATGALRFYVTDGWGTVNSVTTSAQSVAANTWVHIAATWSMKFFNAQLQIYINGTPTTGTNGLSLGGIHSGIGTLYIGDSRANITTNGGTVSSANGLIDEFQVHGAVLSSTEVAALRNKIRVCDAPSGTLVAGQRYSFESYDWAGWYIRHQAWVGKISQYGANPTDLERNDATFVARPGLADSNCWSFESVNFPGQYLRHQLFNLYLHTYSTSGSYLGDATFCLRAGLADSAAISLESQNTPGWFVYHKADGFLGLASNAGTQAFAESATFRVASPFALGLHHLEITHGTGTGLTCTPSTVTITACEDASCTTRYTGGLSGTLTASGVTTVFPSGASFSIASGASSTTKSLQLTAAGTAVLGLSGLSVSTSSGTVCNFGSPSCTFSASDAGLLFDVPHHTADVTQSITVAAVRKSDNSNACTPAFASVTRPVTFKCAYTNPSSGSLPVKVGGTALNAGANAAAACDAGGRSISLSFNANGVASTSVQYADAGSVTLTGTYTGSNATGDTGLTMSGSDGFIAAPYRFAVSAQAGTQVAGSAFSATVSALNHSGSVTPNFGREQSAEGVSLGWVRTQPQGTGASNGSFSGSVGAFSGGAASAASLQWTEVGRGDVSARLSSGSYLGTGLAPAGSTEGAPVLCASEWSTCEVPAGATATIYYGVNGFYLMRTSLTGSVWCSNNLAGDPMPGLDKYCWYVLTSGSTGSTTGAVGPFRPHHLDLSASPACSSFSYASQPFSATVTARNAAGATTVNYDGVGSLSPVFSKAVTLSEATALGKGSLSGNTVAAAQFSAGVATVSTPAYAFTDKLTGPQTLALRATDADGVSSSGYTEATMPLRSGRLALSNAFGSEKASLQVPMRVLYWSGSSWLLNSADTCTSIPTSAVVRPVVRKHDGTNATWTSAVSSVSLSGGSGAITLAAPSPLGTGTVDLAVNLGSGTADDASCLASHASSAGAAAPWLRSRNGNCASTYDRDPSARASFGVYAPETRKTIHLRELF